MDESPKMPPGSYGCHEALHMASFFAEAVDEQLCGHPAIQQNTTWMMLASNAAKALADLYQAIGAEHLGAIPDPTRPVEDG
jgi:hypothetical protein